MDFTPPELKVQFRNEEAKALWEFARLDYFTDFLPVQDDTEASGGELKFPLLEKQDNQIPGSPASPPSPSPIFALWDLSGLMFEFLRYFSDTVEEIPTEIAEFVMDVYYPFLSTGSIDRHLKIDCEEKIRNFIIGSIQSGILNFAPQVCSLFLCSPGDDKTPVDEGCGQADDSVRSLLSPRDITKRDDYVDLIRFACEVKDVPLSRFLHPRQIMNPSFGSGAFLSYFQHALRVLFCTRTCRLDGKRAEAVLAKARALAPVVPAIGEYLDSLEPRIRPILPKSS